MNWRQQLRNSTRSLIEVGNLFHVPVPINELTIASYPLQITPHYLSLINKSNPDDPLKKLIIPSNSELNGIGLEDTMGEKEDYKIQGIQHRYTPTALLILNNVCASYCRYCFRKRLFDPGNLEVESVKDLKSALSYIKHNKQITNVLLSGGDPLLSSAKRLNNVLTFLAQLDHIRYVRIGTKIPAFLPQRIIEDHELISVLSGFNKHKPLFIVSHFDHANEISVETGEAVEVFLRNGIPVLSQSVLLKDINDHSESIMKLMSKLISNRIIPYYVFQAMPVIGSTHFQIPISRGINIIQSANQKLSGLDKKFRFILPHYIGKVEIIGQDESFFYMKYHQARESNKIGQMFKVQRDNEKVWFDKDEVIDMICR